MDNRKNSLCSGQALAPKENSFSIRHLKSARDIKIDNTSVRHIQMLCFQGEFKYMKDVQSAIECWASRPTWFSSHPNDAKELRQAISNLKKLEYPPSEDDLRGVIYQRVKDLPAMLGTPKNIEHTVREFSAKIFSKL